MKKDRPIHEKTLYLMEHVGMKVGGERAVELSPTAAPAWAMMGACASVPI